MQTETRGLVRWSGDERDGRQSQSTSRQRAPQGETRTTLRRVIRTFCKRLTGPGRWGRNFVPYTDDLLKRNKSKAFMYFRFDRRIAPEHPLLISLTQPPHIVGVLGVRVAQAQKP